MARPNDLRTRIERQIDFAQMRYECVPTETIQVLNDAEALRVRLRSPIALECFAQSRLHIALSEEIAVIVLDQ